MSGSLLAQILRGEAQTPMSFADRIAANPIGTQSTNMQYLSNQSPSFDPLAGFIDGKPWTQTQVDALPVNPITGSLNDQGKMIAEVLMGGTSSPATIAKRIAQHAQGLGYAVSRDASKLSGSEYLSLAHDSLPDQTLKVRISDHDLPPSYGVPGDIDVHAGTPRALSAGWSDAVKWLSEKIGAPVPPRAASELTRQANKQVQADAVNERMLRSSPAYQEGTLERAFPDEWAAAVAMTGRDRSLARQALAARYESQNPGVMNWAPYLKPKP